MTPPDPIGEADELLTRWTQAGLITESQAAAIRSHEGLAERHGSAGSDARAAPRLPAVLPRPSGIEILAYLGVIIALVGVMTLLLASGASLALIGSVTSLLGVCALAAMFGFTRVGNATGRRAAGACLGLAAAGIGIGAGELCRSASLLISTQVFFAGTPERYTTVDDNAVVLFGACVVLLIAFGLIRLVPGVLAAMVGCGAAYTAAAMIIAIAGWTVPGGNAAIALTIVVTSAALLLAGETLRLRQPRTHQLLGMIGVIGASVPLYILGGGGNLDLDVSGGVISTVALVAGIRLSRPGVAYAAGVGIGGAVLDIGGRNFTSATSLGIFLMLVGAGGVAALVAINRLLRHHNTAAAD